MIKANAAFNKIAIAKPNTTTEPSKKESGERLSGFTFFSVVNFINLATSEIKKQILQTATILEKSRIMKLKMMNDEL
jgi:hypothetical protein